MKDERCSSQFAKLARSASNNRMLAGVLLSSLSVALATSMAIAAEQPAPRTGHVRPMVFLHSPPGPDGTLGMAVLSAVVNSDGSVARGAGATGASSLGTGAYEVDFNRDVSGCTYVSTVGPANGGEVDRGQSNVAPRSLTPDGVFVETSDSAGNLHAFPFHLIVFCAK